MYRQNIDTLEDLAVYLNEGINNRKRSLRDMDDSYKDHIMGEIYGFQKVLQILDAQFNIQP